MKIFRTVTAYILAIIGSSLVAQTAGAAPLDVRWSTGVHNLMIELAFPNEDYKCLVQMKRGSRSVDNMQGPNEAYMHAMRGSGESVETAIKKTWEFINRKYADAKREPYSDMGCYLRGQALHPVMDGTSPAHYGTQTWEPLQHRGQLFEHGDWAARLGSFLPPLLTLLIPQSREDLTYLDDHPDALWETIEIMKTLDKIELEITHLDD